MPRPSLLPLLAAAAIALVAGGATAAARPFDASRLPADVEGVGHVDADALRTTQLYGALRGMAGLDKPDLSGAPAELRPLVEYLITGTRGVSFWIGASDTGALIVEVTDGKKLGALLDKLPHKSEVTLAGTRARRYDLDGDATVVARVGDLVVLSDDDASVTRTLEVLTGKKKSLKGRTLHGARDAGVFFFAALDDKLLDQVKQAASSAMLKADLTSLTISVGEVKAELRARAIAEVTTPEAAQQIKGVIEGLRALVSLADDAKEVKPLLDKLTVTATGTRVEISIAMPATEFLKLVDAAR